MRPAQKARGDLPAKELVLSHFMIYHIDGEGEHLIVGITRDVTDTFNQARAIAAQEAHRAELDKALAAVSNAAAVPGIVLCESN